MIYIIKTVLLFKREHNSLIKTDKNKHLRSVRIRSFSGPCFPTFGLNAERYGASMGNYGPERLRIQTISTQ